MRANGHLFSENLADCASMSLSFYSKFLVRSSQKDRTYELNLHEHHHSGITMSGKLVFSVID